MQTLQGFQTLTNSALEGQGLQLRNQQSQAGLNTTAAANMAKGLYGLLSLPPDQRVGKAGYDNIKREADFQLSMNPTEANHRIHQQFLAQLEAPLGADGKTPTDYTGRLAQHLLSSAAISGPEAVQLTLGSPSSQNTGGHTLQGTASGVMMNGAGSPSQFTPGSSTNATPSVSDNLATRNTVDTRQFLPDGKPNPNYNQPITVPAVGTMPGIQSNPLVTPLGRGTYRGPLPQAPAGLPAPASQGGPPRLSGAIPAPAPGPSASPQAGLPSGTLPSSAAPGTMAPIEASTAQYIQARDQDNQYASNLEALNHMSALSKKTTTGAGSLPINEVRSFLQNVSGRVGAQAAKIDTATADELGKMFAQYVNSRGAGSDARLAALGAGSMSMDKSALANQDLIERAKMLARMDHTAFQTFKKAGGTPGTFADHYNSFTNENHPLAFYDFADDKQKRAAMGRMSQGQLAQYVKSHTKRSELESSSESLTTPTPGE